MQTALEQWNIKSLNEIKQKLTAIDRSSGIFIDLTEAIATLAERGKLTAIEALEQGDTAFADAVLAEKIAEIKSTRVAATRAAAALYRQRGALAFLGDIHTAETLYTKAADLDPNDPEAWNRLGHIQTKLGNIKGAEECYTKVVDIGVALKDLGWQAIGLAHLGNIYFSKGNIPEAEELLDNVLNIYNKMGPLAGACVGFMITPIGILAGACVGALAKGIAANVIEDRDDHPFDRFNISENYLILAKKFFSDALRLSSSEDIDRGKILLCISEIDAFINKLNEARKTQHASYNLNSAH